MRFPFGESIEVSEPDQSGAIDPWTGEPVLGMPTVTTYERVFVFRDEVAEDAQPDRTAQSERYSVFFGEDHLDVAVSRHATVRLLDRGGIVCETDGPSHPLRHPATGWNAGPVLKLVRAEG